MDGNAKIEQLIAKAERIGVIGSPSSTSELSLDILASATTKKLIGELALFQYQQDAIPHYAMGQITEISLRNIWHEDPTMRSLIRQRGRIDAVSERQDTHLGEMTVSAVFAHSGIGYRPSMLGTVPATGTRIYLADDSLLDELLKPYRQQLFYMGYVYGSTPRLPLWFKHFDSGTEGAGEAYHLGVFGKTGSGKSTLAKMMLIAYLRHKNMGVIVFDPQGEFSLSMRDQTMPKSMGKILSPKILDAIGREARVYGLPQIRLDRWEVFRELLIEYGFFFDLGIKSSEYQGVAADYVVDFLRNSGSIRLSNLDDSALREALGNMQANITRIYASVQGRERVIEFISEAIQNIEKEGPQPIRDKWRQVIRFFNQGATPSQILGSALSVRSSRPLIILDLSQKPDDIAQGIWDDRIKPLLIDSFLDTLLREAEKAYKNEQSLNTLVVLDEAHRLAPQERTRTERTERIKANLIDAVRTTRKYGLGWLFLSQTLSSLSTEIVQQLRISFFGFGLSMGSEFVKLRELVGGQRDSINLYQRFRDPQSAFDIASREYSFMTIGPVSPLSFSGTPLFLNAYNTVGDFVRTNGIATQGTLF